MPDTVRKMQYWKAMVPDRPGEGAKALDAFRAAGVNLVAFTGFPNGRRGQLDFVPEDGAALRRAAKSAGVKLEGPKTCFVIQGDDRVGALASALAKLGDAGINVTAVNGVAGGGGRWGALLWVDPRAAAKASKVLGAS